MKRYWAWAMTGFVLIGGNLGCYYDQWQDEMRAHRVTQEKLAEVQDDLQNCQLMNAQKDTQIASLTDQVNTKDSVISSLQAEAISLRNALERAQAILEKQAGRSGPGQLTILNTKLPEPLHQQLQELARQFPDQIEYLPEKGAVRWKSDLLFPLGSDQLAGESESADALNRFAEIVQSQSASGFDVIVVGHTCDTPIRRPETLARFKDNWYLSAARAISVMKMLANQGVQMPRMGIMGYGEFRPIASNATAEGKTQNRRVEIYLVPKETVQSVSQGISGSPEHRIAFVPADSSKLAALGG